MKIEIAGPGCPRCIATEKNVKEAVKQLGIQAEIVHVYDIAEVTKRGVMFTPAVIVDGEVKISGKIPTVEEIKKVLSSK
ncbi:MAG: thioredoxin family protein [Candidatus Omnitrophica bacterium]|nr:thioredoxin family protein [Candidatus Omnitrophota bacterium]